MVKTVIVQEIISRILAPGVIHLQNTLGPSKIFRQCETNDNNYWYRDETNTVLMELISCRRNGNAEMNEDVKTVNGG